MQSVNLYRDDVVLRGARLDAPVLLRGLAALGAALVLASAMLLARDVWMARSLASLRARAAQAESAIAELKARHARQLDTAGLDARLSAAAREIELREQRLGQIRALSENRGGFSTRLEALAAGDQPGVWLESFAFARGGRELALRGRALRPEQVPGFMLALGEQAPFAGTEFHELVLERSGVEPALRFELRTAGPAAPLAAEGER